jgi:hypothetical protein
MTDRTGEVQQFLDRTASEVRGIDSRTPPRVRRRARIAMSGWALLTGAAALALPVAAMLTLHLGDRSSPRGDNTSSTNRGLGSELVFTRGSQIWLIAPDGQPVSPR